MNKIKICHITTAHSALDTRIFYKEAKSLAQAGYKVHIVGIHPKREAIDGIEIIPLRPSRNRLLRIFLKPLRAMYLSINTRSQIFHFHDPELLPIGIVLKLLGKKVIYDAHEDYPQLMKVKDWIPRAGRFVLFWTTTLFERFASIFFDLTIAPSEPLSMRLSKGMALYNFPSVEILNLLQSHSKPYQERDIDLIHVGVLRKTRLDFFIKILGEIKSEDAQIRSAFVGLTKEQIEYIRENLGGWDNVLLTGKLPFNEVVKLLGRSKLGLNYHPLESHLKYAVPVKMFEYLGAGCVVVCSDFPFFKTIIGDNNSAFFVDHDPKKFSRIILELLKDPIKMADLSKQSQECSLKFTWDREEKKIIDAYKKLL
jgi:glycosyltransferase involved in cell wall biosynthesis